MGVPLRHRQHVEAAACPAIDKRFRRQIEDAPQLIISMGLTFRLRKVSDKVAVQHDNAEVGDALPKTRLL